MPRFFRILPIVALVVLAACSGVGGGATGLPVGITARMDAPGAQLDRGAALDLINAYRSSAGVSRLSSDPALEAEAQRLASAYASSGSTPRRPSGASVILSSAGYADFANVFSGWRARGDDARSLAASASRAGIAVTYRNNSTYGLYWVLILAP